MYVLYVCVDDTFVQRSVASICLDWPAKLSSFCWSDYRVLRNVVVIGVDMGRTCHNTCSSQNVHLSVPALLCLKGNSRLKNYTLRWTFMFNKVAYTAWKWQFMSNKYDVWRFNSRILLAYYDRSKIFFPNAIAYSMVGLSHAERKHSVYTTIVRVRELNLQTSYWFVINCHFHAVCATLLNIKVHLKLYFSTLNSPLSK